MSKFSNKQLTRSSSSEVDQFLQRVKQAPRPIASQRRGRLIFCLDATASREPMWDQACHIQSEMFTATSVQGGLDVQLCFYRGFREFYIGKWVSSATELQRMMSNTRCAGGLTQIGRLLNHAIKENQQSRVNAVVFVGDAVEENVDQLADKAGRLGINGVPVFVFQEGFNPMAARTLREIASLSGGAYCRFDTSSAQQLKDLLAAVAVYATGGRVALENFSSSKRGVVAQLTHQIKRK